VFTGETTEKPPIIQHSNHGEHEHTFGIEKNADSGITSSKVYT
jgi:hypothetical protein